VGHYCEKISPGCKNCYASRLQPRFGLPVFQEQRGELAGAVFLDVSKLDEVLRRKKPTTYFWCDMTDMFGEWVPLEWIAACFGVMAATPQHTHQVLTKRAARMREWFEWIEGRPTGLLGRARSPRFSCVHQANKVLVPNLDAPPRFLTGHEPWPLPNVWLMTSAENQEQADLRIPDLLACPAAVHGVSLEPLLAPVTLARWLHSYHAPEEPPLPTIDWAIVGGESGPKARPFNVEWAEDILDECKGTGTRVFMKQLGANATRTPTDDECNVGIIHPDELWAVRTRDRKGGDPTEWPPHLRVRELPAVRS
jgi:protein gp37